MSLERRLQHAARELRAVDVAVPPLGAAGRVGPIRRFGLHVAAVPLLFVVGGLVVVGVLDDRNDGGGSFDDTPAVVDAPISSPMAPMVAESVAPSSLARPSAAAELVVIDRLVTTATRRDVPTDAAVLSRRSPADLVPL